MNDETSTKTSQIALKSDALAKFGILNIVDVSIPQFSSV